MFANQITEFNESLNSLRAFSSLVEPFLIEKRLVDSVIDNSESLITGIIKDYTNTKIQALPIPEFSKEKMITIPSIIKEAFDTIGEDPILRESMKSFASSLANADTEEFAKIRLSGQMKELKSKFNHIELLNTNTLISLMSFAEWFFVQILHFYFEKYPEAASIDSKSLTYEEIKSFNSIKDAQDYLLDNKIEGIIRGSIDSWFKYLRSQFKLSIKHFALYENTLIEISQRRNLLVHNGGIINSIYISKVNENYRTEAYVGKKIIVDKTYLDSSISTVQVVFILIATEIWLKVDPNDQKRTELIVRLINENMDEGRWDIVEHLSAFILSDKSAPNINKLIAQLNFWLSKKRQGEFEEIFKEIEKIDYSDKPIRYQIAFAALKDNTKLFLELLEDGLIDNQISFEEIDTLPIFDTMIVTKNYKTFKEHYKNR